MSSFTSPLIVKVLEEYRFELYRPFVFHLDSKYSKAKITVPAGFVTDFASVPRAFWSIIAPYGKHAKAAVLHDFLYACHGYAFGDQLVSFTRKECDDIFLKAMEVLGVNPAKRWIMYQAVRLFAGSHWKSGL
jgi:hypothetical protein